ncbi:MAG: tetratricopeptide repeat protein [Spirochaetia bacterium]
MKKIVLLIVTSIILLGSSCSPVRQDYLQQMREFEAEGYEGREITRERVAELEAQIQEYAERVDEIVDTMQDIGFAYKMIARQLMDREMYGQALEYYRQAIEYFPTNKILHYYAGLCAGQMYVATEADQEASEYLNAAVEFYQQAIANVSGYVDALYALSVIYIFELDQPEEAQPLLERIIEGESQNVEARFLLARVYVQQNRIEEAIDLYDTIIEVANSAEARQQAEANKQQLTERGGM